MAFGSDAYADENLEKFQLNAHYYETQPSSSGVGVRKATDLHTLKYILHKSKRLWSEKGFCRLSSVQQSNYNIISISYLPTATGCAGYELQYAITTAIAMFQYPAQKMPKCPKGHLRNSNWSSLLNDRVHIYAFTGPAQSILKCPAGEIGILFQFRGEHERRNSCIYRIYD